MASDITTSKNFVSPACSILGEGIYKAMLEASNNPMLLLNQEDGRVLEANRAACEYFGYTPEEIIQLKNTDLSAQPENSAEVLRGGVEHVAERYQRTKDGRILPTEVFLSFFELDGHKLAFVSVTDITIRVNAERALQKSEARYKGIVESQSDLVIRTDMNGNLTYINTAGAKIFGLEPEQIIGKQQFELMHPDTWLQAKQRLYEFRSHQKCRTEGETLLKTARGYRWFAFESCLIDDNDESQTEIQIVGRDIHDTKLYHEALAKTEERLRMATFAASETIWEHNLQTGEFYVSPYAPAMLGYEPEEFPNTPEGWHLLLHPADRAAFLANREDFISGKIEMHLYNCRLRDKVQGYIWYSFRGRAYERDENGRAIRVGGTIANINESQLSRERLVQAHKDLKKAYQTQNEFLNCITHEVRTPLIAVQGYAEMLMEGFAGPTTRLQQELLQRIISSSKLLTDTVSGVLEIARVKSGRSTLKMEIFDPLTLVDRVKSAILPQAERKKLSFEVYNNGCFSAGYTDTAKLSIILTNLFSNAIKFTQSGGVKVFVESYESHITVIVVDSGRGMSESDLTVIFDEFQQLACAEKYKSSGFGIGLAVVAEMVHALGGTLVASSEKGTGSAFTLLVPKVNIQKDHSTQSGQ